MKNVSQRRNHIGVIVGALIVLLLASGLGVAYVNHSDHNSTKTKDTSDVRPENSVDYSPSSPSDSSENNTRKSNPTPASTLDSGPTQSSGSNATYSVQITGANLTSNNTNVHVGTLVSGVTSGSCTLTATQGSQTVNLQSSNVQQDVNQYDCGVYNIATTQFPSSGSWKLTLTVASNGVSNSDSATVNIP